MPSDFELTLTSHELFALPAGTAATGSAFRVEVTRHDRASFFALARLLATKAHPVAPRYEKRTMYNVFFRIEERPEDGIFEGSSFLTNDAIESPSEEKLAQYTVHALSNAGGYKRFWKSPELPYGLELTSDGLGRVLIPGKLLHSASDFRWGGYQESQFFAWGISEFHGFCEKLVEDTASELNFFFDWQNVSPEEKTAVVTRCECGDWGKMLQLFRWVLQLVTHHFGVYPLALVRGSYWKLTWSDIEIEEISSYAAADIYMLRWRNALLNIIRPSFWPDEPLCCTAWRRGNSKVEQQVSCSIVTAHEVVEAQLGLREFLGPHLSESEIEALLIP